MKNKQLKIISYNLKWNKASKELSSLIEQYDSDILCVQECYTETMPETIGHMQLAEKTKSTRLGLAVYFRPERFNTIRSESFIFKSAVVERLRFEQNERLLISQFFDHVSGQNIYVGSFHAMHLLSSNMMRRKQIQTAHNIMKEYSDGAPAIMVGDYNHPIFRRKLKVCIENTGYNLSFSDRPTYYMTKMLKGHFDLAASINTQIEQVRTLPRGLSDHAPILVQALV